MKKAIVLSISVIGMMAVTHVSATTLRLMERTFADKMISIGDEESITLKITGMTCGGCANYVSIALSEMDGIISEDVSYPGDRNTITFDPDKTSVDKIIAAIEKAGYKAEILKD
ncbi:MAG: cation transporter [Flavobacteriales bacterium]|nr:cation transporter [Flavobacteriales bacterium]